MNGMEIDGKHLADEYIAKVAIKPVKSAVRSRPKALPRNVVAVSSPPATCTRWARAWHWWETLRITPMAANHALCLVLALQCTMKVIKSRWSAAF